MTYSEEDLNYYWSAVSDTEEEKIEHAKSMIRDAINNSAEFSGLDYEIFEQGSYANKTNIRLDSDIDICVMLKSTFYAEYPDELTREYCGFPAGTINFNDYKQRVVNALNEKFETDTKIGNKSIKITSNSYRVKADVVVAFQYRDYKISNSRDADDYTEGIGFISNTNGMVINYPKEHIENGITKNKETGLMYKKLVKIFKNIKSNMEDKRLIGDEKISSFLIESLIWNVPNDIIMNRYGWLEVVKKTIKYLYKKIQDNECSEWGEVSECLYLFRENRKWTCEDVKDFLLKMWNHMGYK
jgi:predicted nucleotidyltransferase